MLPGHLEQTIVHGRVEHVVLEDIQIFSRSSNPLCGVLPGDIDGWLLVFLVNEGAVPWLIMRRNVVSAVN